MAAERFEIKYLKCNLSEQHNMFCKWTKTAQLMIYTNVDNVSSFNETYERYAFFSSSTYVA